MTQDALHVAKVDGVYWTLFVELKFYVLFSIVVFLGLTYRRALPSASFGASVRSWRSRAVTTSCRAFLS
jgi:peptidoglycan/LPS O-acetylase OafA/YrhL